MIYKPTSEERLAKLEEENIENTNCFYELHNIIDRIEVRLNYLENLIIGDNK